MIKAEINVVNSCTKTNCPVTSLPVRREAVDEERLQTRFTLVSIDSSNRELKKETKKSGRNFTFLFFCAKKKEKQGSPLKCNQCLFVQSHLSRL